MAPREHWPIGEMKQPAFADLEPVWIAQAPQTRALLASITDWNGEIEWRSSVSPPGKTIVLTATRGDIFSQMIVHEVHHRAQVMAMLRQFGIAAQNLDYSLLMYRRREEPA